MIRPQAIAFAMLCVTGSHVIAQTTAQTTVQTMAQTTAPTISHATLHPGDVVRLRIWKEPDMSGDFPVDERGSVTLPRLGSRVVTAIPPDSLRTALIADYQHYLENPSIEITLLWRIKVVGAVAKPGLYPVDPTMVLSDAIALAGGITPNGVQDEVQLVRNGVRIPIALHEPPRIGTALQSGDELFVPTRPWLSRNVIIIPASVTALVSFVRLLSH